jgi:hypothetical protein
MNDFQFENLIKAVEITFKQNYCAMYFEDLVIKYSPEITEGELKAAVRVMYDRDQLTTDGSLLRLIVR